jgi:hypothetical protein
MKHSWIQRALVTASSLLAPLVVANTYHVPGDFSLIQQAILATSAGGDTILIAPGRYVENLDFLGKDIVLTSLYQPGGDESIIRETILDGGQNGSVVTFVSGESRAAVLNGFTVTNGSGRDRDFLGTCGGGLYIEQSSPSITHCRIVGNQCSGLIGGGGILIGNSNAFLSGLTITGNSAQNMGGGIYQGLSYPELDSLNRCNVYLNNAAVGNDIYQYTNGSPSVRYHLDSASVAFTDSYFMSGDVAMDADILQGVLTPVAHDLWVSPFGDDGNSGLSEFEPLKTIAHALAIIDADSLHHRIINLLPGTYSPSDGQLFPLNLRSCVTLEGAGRDSTILDMEFTAVRVFGAIDKKVDCSVKSLTVKRLAYGIPGEAFQIMQSTNLLLEDLRFTENNAQFPVSTNLYGWMNIDPGTSIVVRDCLFDNNHSVKILSLYLHQYMTVYGCTFDMSTPLDGVPPDDIHLGVATAMGMNAYLGYETSIEYKHRIENCIFTRNISTNTGGARFSPGLNLKSYSDHPIDVVNCTFADNSSPYTGGIRLSPWSTSGMQARIANCLFWGNEPYQVWIDGDYAPPAPPIQVLFSHCLIQDAEAGVYDFGNTETLFLEGIIDADPLFLGEGEEPYRLSADSPAIDAGTAFWIVEGDTVVNLSQDEYSGSAPDIGAYEWIPTSAREVEVPFRPADFGITSIAPNPFNPTTKIRIHLSRPGKAQLRIYDMLGREVGQIANGHFAAGDYALQFRARELPSGIYVAELRTEEGSDLRKLTLLR